MYLLSVDGYYGLLMVVDVHQYLGVLTLEYTTACPVWGSIACATPDRFVLPRCNASTRPTLLTLATVSLLMTKEVEVWGLGPPFARIFNEVAK